MVGEEEGGGEEEEGGEEEQLTSGNNHQYQTSLKVQVEAYFMKHHQRSLNYVKQRNIHRRQRNE